MLPAACLWYKGADNVLDDEAAVFKALEQLDEWQSVLNCCWCTLQSRSARSKAPSCQHMQAAWHPGQQNPLTGLVFVVQRAQTVYNK